jgi:putative oxidoreductase
MAHHVTIVLAVLRTLTGLYFVVVGVMKIVLFGASVANFTRWGLPVPGVVVVLVAAVEIVCGALLAAGALTRPVGLLLATLMVAATLTAGRTDGGVYLVVPPLLFAVTVFFAWRSARFPAPVTRRPGVQ